MSEPSPVSDPYAYMRNEDGSITRYPARLPRNPYEEPYPPYKDIIVNHSKNTRMRLYVPKATLNGGVSSPKLPLIVYFHGGKFIICSIAFRLYHEFCDLMSRELNVVVACPSYRLAPDDKLPAAYDDGVDALEWIRNSDDVWINSHADLSNVFLMGTDTGGNLAYNVGLRSTVRNLTPLRIRGLILHYPLFGGKERCESEFRHVDHLPAVDDFWKLCLPEGANRDHEYSNPTVGDGPDNMEKIGRLGWKVMVSGGEGDPLIDRQRYVVKLMKEKGVDVVERFTDDDCYAHEIAHDSKAQTLFASIRSII